MVATLFVAVTINFAIFQAAPGDVTARFSQVPDASPKLREELRREFGLDRSLPQQYWNYLTQLAQGNLGISFANRDSVSSNLSRAVLNSLPMALLGTFLAIVLGIFAGVMAAWRRGSALDHASVGAGLTFYALPAQWVGIMLIFLAGGMLPAGGDSDPFLINPGFVEAATDKLRHMVLPALTLGFVLFGVFTLTVRSAMSETLGEDYILTAKAKGLNNWAVIRRHAFRNAMLPTITLIALTLGSVVGSYVLVETVFSWPGIGQSIYQAVVARDYPMLQGAFLILTVSVLVCNFVADLLYARLDPRVRI
jgi:ABC-type dipeptide/oligopeptide/nickel transport system permease component